LVEAFELLAEGAVIDVALDGRELGAEFSLEWQPFRITNSSG
jgi:hypothetical protein